MEADSEKTQISIQGFLVAKQKKNDPAGGIVILIMSFIGAIILLASFLAVFVLIGTWIHFERAIKRYPGVRGQGDINLSPEDKQKLRECLEAKERIQERISEIDSRKHELLVRKDGSFDGRSKEGRALNDELESLRSDLSACNVTIIQLDSWERETYSDWVTNKSGLFASRAAIYSLPISITAFFFYQPALLVSLSSLIESQTGLKKPGGIDGFYGVLTFGAWSALVIFLLLWAISAMFAPKFIKK